MSPSRNTLTAKQILDAYERTGSVRRASRELGCRTGLITETVQALGKSVKPGGHANYRMNPEQTAEVVARYQGGESMREISRAFEISYPTIRGAVKRAGLPTRKPGTPKFWTAERLAEAETRLRQGESAKQIGQSFGVHPNSVWTALRHAGGDMSLRSKRIGPAHHSWKGGRATSGEYILVKPTAEDIAAGLVDRRRYVLEHRLIVSRMLGRPLRRTETVHHLDGNGANNSPNNLQLRQGNHGKGFVARCGCCGSNDIEFVPLEDLTS